MELQVKKPDLKGHILALMFGLVLPLSLAPFDGWPIGILSIAGLIMLLQNLGRSGCFWRSFCFGLGMFASGASWIFVSIHDYGQASILLSLLLISLFVLLLALLFALPFILYGSGLNRLTGMTLLAFPSLWVLGEWFRGWVFSGFPWLYLGYGHIDSWLSGWAPITGVLGLSWIAVFCGSILGLTVKSKKHRSLGPALCCALLLWLSGWYLQTVQWTKAASEPLSIGLVQPAVPLGMKWDQNKLLQILNQYREDTNKLLKHDIVVWPESAIPRLKHEMSDYLSTLATEAKETQTSLITGIPTQNQRSGLYYNSVVGLGYASGSYHKQHLVPFGEYVPFEQWLRGAIAFFDLPMSSFSPGPDIQEPIVANGITIATAICYEIAFPDLVAKSAGNVNLLLTVSNDTWFGRSIGPQQHFQMARMRALENGKPLIRATNDGITALVNARGKVVSTIPSYNRGTLEGYLTPFRGTTPFGKRGSIPILMISVILLLIATWHSFRRPSFPA
jgi:apolipoprotein N-acyltransferase